MGGKTRILIVEDNEDNRTLFSYLLEKAGYEVHLASTGEQGLTMAWSVEPDLILMDIQLPDIMGDEVVRRYRKSGGSATILTITSFAMAGDRERLIAAGCDAYLEKPVEAGQLLRTIADILGEER
jgi:CheY-like chemotaxis protein